MWGGGGGSVGIMKITPLELLIFYMAVTFYLYFELFEGKRML